MTDHNAITTTDNNQLAIHDDRVPNPVDSYLGGLPSENSRRVQRGALKAVAIRIAYDDDLPDNIPDGIEYQIAWHAFRHTQVAAIRAWLAQVYAPSTANRYMSAVKGALKASWRNGLIDNETYAQATDVKAIRGRRVAKGRHIPRNDIRRLLATCGQETIDIRDRAIIVMLYMCGLRRAEVANMQIADYRPDVPDIVVRGKGNQEREVELNINVIDAVDKWLLKRGRGAGYLFNSVRQNSSISNNSIGEDGIYKMMVKRATIAGIEDISPHDFRRTFIGNMLSEGADISVVQGIVGHASPDTTARYDRRPKAARKAAIDKLTLPE